MVTLYTPDSAFEASDLSRPAPPEPSAGDEAILTALGDPVMRRILLALSARARSALELVHELDIPQSSLYRKLHDLERLQLVGIVQRIITEGGKPTEMFRSRVSEVRIEMDGQHLQVRVVPRDLHQERLRSMWRALRSEVRR